MLQRFDAIAQPGRLLVAEALGEVREARSARRTAALTSRLHASCYRMLASVHDRRRRAGGDDAPSLARDLPPLRPTGKLD
jgi:hypothetical protein